MKRVLLWILLAVVLLGGAAVFMYSRIDTAFILARIADTTARATGAPLELESAPGLSLLPPGIRFGRARWQGRASGLDVGLTVEGGLAQLEVGPLFSGNLVLREVMLERPALTLRRQSGSPLPGQGRPAAGSPAGDTTADAAHRATPPGTAPDDALPLELARLVIKGGSLSYADDFGTMRMEGFNLSVENLRRREEAEVQGDFVLDLVSAPAATPDRGVPRASRAAAPETGTLLKGNLAFRARVRYYAPNLTLRQASVTLTPLAGVVPAAAGPLQLSADAALNLQTLRLRLALARLSTPPARLELRGEGALAPLAFTADATVEGSLTALAALAGLRLAPSGDALSLQSRVELTETAVHLQNMRAGAGTLTLNGDLAIGLPLGAQAMSLRGEVRATTLALAEFLPRSAAGPKTEAEKTAVRARGASADVKARAKSGTQGNAKAGATPATGTGAGLPTLDLGVSVATVRHAGLELRNLSFRLRGEAGRYAVDNLAAGLAGGGALSGRMAADLPASRYSLDAAASGVALAPLCAAFGKPGAASGTASLTARLGARGADADALLASLDGQGVLEASDLRFEAMQGLAQNMQELARIPALSGLATIVPERIDKARAPFSVTRGVLEARPVTASGRGIAVSGQVRVELARSFLDGSATLAALGLRIPLLFSGPFGAVSLRVDPKFALELGSRIPAGLARGILDQAKPGSAVRNGADAAATGAGNAGSGVRRGLEEAGGLVRGLFGR